MKRTIGTWIVVLAVLLTTECAPRRGGSMVTFHDPNMDFSLIQTVAVMPFANLAPVTAAGERVRDVFMTMLQATGQLYVLPPGEIGRGLSRSSVVNPTSPSAEEVVAFAKVVSADVVITGTVLEYGETRSGSGSANVISVSLKMLEAKTGRVVWSAAATKGGVGASQRLLGGGGQPMNDVTVQAMNDLLDKMFAKK